MATDQYEAYFQIKSSRMGPNFTATSKNVLSKIRDRCCPFLQFNLSEQSQ